MQLARRLNDTRTSKAIVDHGNPDAWNGTPTTATVMRPNDAEVFDGVIGALDFYLDGSLDVRCFTSLNPHLHRAPSSVVD